MLGVGAVMLIASFISLRQREAALESTLRDELRAHAVTLQIALEENYQNRSIADAQRLIDLLRENTRIYGVFLFDENGDLRSRAQLVSAEDFRQPPEVKTVLETGEPIEFVRLVEDRKFFSVILPLRQTPEKRGAVEIVKPLALIENDVSRARLNWLSTTLLLLATIFFLVFFVLRQNLSRPIQAVLVGARALGRGDLSYRVAVKDSHDELAQLAAEFNRMAESLAEQRRAAETETETRLNLEKELRHSERLASVGKLASGIAHELGAPLNVIDARAEQLLHSPDVAVEKRIKNLTIIRSQCSRITHIVRQLLNLARPYDLQLEEIRVGDLIRSALEGFEASETIKIDFEANNGLTILGDGDFLRQVFFNIFHNAVHAMSAGGELKIEISKTAHENRNFVVVEISDTGTGIAPDSLERIFEPFYTTKPIGEGTGLGLSVSRRIVEEHGGIIEASNNATNGARFTIYLPTNEEL